MKKLLLISVMIFLFFMNSAYVFAGSSRVISMDKVNGRMRIYAEGDSISNLTIDMNKYEISGKWLHYIRTVPSSPDAVYDVSVSDSYGYVMCDATSRSTTAKENYACFQITGSFEKVKTDLTLSVDDLGAGSTNIYLDFE